MGVNLLKSFQVTASSIFRSKIWSRNRTNNVGNVKTGEELGNSGDKFGKITEGTGSSGVRV